MYEQILVVKYIPEKNCFLHLPQKLQKQYFIQVSIYLVILYITYIYI